MLYLNLFGIDKILELSHLGLERFDLLGLDGARQELDVRHVVLRRHLSHHVNSAHTVYMIPNRAQRDRRDVQKDRNNIAGQNGERRMPLKPTAHNHVVSLNVISMLHACLRSWGAPQAWGGCYQASDVKCRRQQYRVSFFFVATSAE